MEKLMAPIESVDPGWTKVVSRKQKRANMVAFYVEDKVYGAGAARSKRRSNCYGDGGDDEIAARDEKKVVSRTQKRADRAENISVYVEDESYGAGVARSRRRSNCYGDGGDDEIAARDENLMAEETNKLDEIAARDENLKAEETKMLGEIAARDDNLKAQETKKLDEIAARDENLKAEETKKLKPNKEKKKPNVSLLEAAENICPKYLEIFLTKVTEEEHPKSGFMLLKFADFFDIALYSVRFSFPEIFKEPPSFKLNDVIDVPFSHFPESVYKTSSRWINTHPIFMLGGFALYAFEQIRAFLAREQGGPPPRACNSQVSIFVALAMILRSKPTVMAVILPNMKKRGYLGPDDLPVIVWMIAQASQSDLSIGLYLWVHGLLPLVGSNPQTRDLILQLVEKILSNPRARTILVSNPFRVGQRVIPPPSFEILLRLTFPASSARVKATKRFEAIYPLLKAVALAGAPGSEAMKQVTQQIFTFSLKLTQEGSPVLAKEATAIAIWCVTKNVDCCKHWDSLYKENLGASVAVLKKLVDKWKDHSLKLSSPQSDALTLNRTMKSFRLKNEKAITEGGVNGSLYKEADECCKVILGRLSRGSGHLKKGTAIIGIGRLKGTAITAVVLAAAVVLSINLEATTVLKTLLDSLDLHL